MIRAVAPTFFVSSLVYLVRLNAEVICSSTTALLSAPAIQSARRPSPLFVGLCTVRLCLNLRPRSDVSSCDSL